MNQAQVLEAARVLASGEPVPLMHLTERVLMVSIDIDDSAGPMRALVRRFGNPQVYSAAVSELSYIAQKTKQLRRYKMTAADAADEILSVLPVEHHGDTMWVVQLVNDLRARGMEIVREKR